MGGADWRNHGVKVLRAAETSGKARATAFNFAGGGGSNVWIGTVTLQPNGRVEAHHHGTHEVAIYVNKGRSEIRWGESLEFTTQVGAGDFVYFAPGVPHQEANPDHRECVEFVVIRSDDSAVRVDLDITPFDHPETVY